MEMSLDRGELLPKNAAGKRPEQEAELMQQPHKLAHPLLLTQAHVTAKTRPNARFLKRKMAEYEARQREIEALKAEADGRA